MSYQKAPPVKMLSSMIIGVRIRRPSAIIGLINTHGAVDNTPYYILNGFGGNKLTIPHRQTSTLIHALDEVIKSISNGRFDVSVQITEKINFSVSPSTRRYHPEEVGSVPLSIYFLGNNNGRKRIWLGSHLSINDVIDELLKLKTWLERCAVCFVEENVVVERLLPKPSMERILENLIIKVPYFSKLGGEIFTVTRDDRRKVPLIAIATATQEIVFRNEDDINLNKLISYLEEIDDLDYLTEAKKNFNFGMHNGHVVSKVNLLDSPIKEVKMNFDLILASSSLYFVETPNKMFIKDIIAGLKTLRKK